MRPLARPLAAAPAAALAALLAVAAAPPAAATSYVPVADPDLLAAAQAVVEARVLSVAPAPADGGWPATDYMIEVERLVAGEVSGRNLLVRLPGGTRPDGSGMRVYGVPRFGIGEELLLFLGAGDDGTYHVTHLMLGAFRERVVAGRRVLLRDLDGATEVSLPGRTVDPRTFDPRDAARFSRWLADAARGIERDADYFLADEEVRGIERVSGAFNFFSDDRTGSNLRWFRFDEGRNVLFRIAPGGQPGFGEEATGAAVQQAVAAWNGAPGTRIAYAYGGVASGGTNMIQFNNAGDEIDEDFSCSSGGVLAVGGPAYSFARVVGPGGELFHPITNGGVTLNEGIECFLQRVPNSLAQLIAHELGHTLGFHHSCGDGLNSCNGASSTLLDALMHPNIHNDSRGARLGDDDRAAARQLYPGSGGGGGGSPVAAPSDLSATAISSSEVELTWSDNSDDETQFRVEARPAGGSFARVATTGANATGATVGGLSPATAYDFRVQARRGTTASPFSPSASATTLPDAPAAPGSLAAAALSADGVTLTWSDESSDEIGFAIEVRTPSTEGWNEIAAVPPGTTELTLDLPSGVPHSFRVRALGTERPSEPSEVVSVTPQAPDAPCGGDPAVLCLDQRFRVTVDWRNPHGVGFGTGTAAAFAGDQSGTFWFFDPANVELIVKVLDGTALNDHFWIFHGALTDVEYWISVLDTATGRSRTYYNPPFDQCGELDTAGIPGGEELPAAAGNALVFPNPTPAAASAAATDCGDDDTLCLLGGRFEVEVDWVNQHQPGDVGVGHRVPGTDQTGYFWFFDPSNVELVVKALDARAVNGRFWVFFGSLSDVEYTITVTDTETLEQRTYVNNPGSTCGQFDTAAFPIDTAGLVAPAP